MRGLVFGLNAEEIFLAERSIRALAACGVAAGSPAIGGEAIAGELRATSEPLLMLQCGCWPAAKLPACIPSSDTGLPLAALGSTENESIPRCLYLEPASAHRLAALLQSMTWEEAVRALMEDQALRCVWHHGLAVAFDPKLRVLQAVTTIQIGGAEKVAIDLAEHLRKRGHRVWLAGLSAPTRRAYPVPAHYFDLRKIERSPRARAAALAGLARRLHADLIHGHLISGAESEALHATGMPLVVTLHNMPQAWPAGFHSPSQKADLLIACSQTVARAMPDPGTPCRVAWNGIPNSRYAPTAERRELAAAWRRERGWGDADFVVIAVANPRAQKRLHLIPGIFSALQSKLPSRKVRCIIAGEPSHNADAREAEAALAEAIARSDMGADILRTGASDQVPLLLNASDAFLSTSSYEGLSLSHLEALAAGIPVVTTDVGGAGEIARELGDDAAFYQRLPVDSDAFGFADALLCAPVRDHESKLPAAFHSEKMAHRTEQLYKTALSLRQRSVKQPEGLWLITNNFSMGGAQSSARRLLVELQKRGIDVHAFTVQEEQPTRGSNALRESGIPVTAIPVSSRMETALGVALILAHAAERPPQAVLFWNLIVSYKLLLADGLEGIPAFDVSPGEMNFHSLAKYFQSPRPELPCRSSAEYGELLAGAVVKFPAEQATAETLLGIPATVIPNGVPLPPRNTRASSPKLLLGTAARISPDKRLEDLLDAFALAHPSLPPCELHIAGRVENGADAYAAMLREKAARLPVVWLGELPDTADFLQSLDLFLMISEPAGCPNASLEAMAAGLTVIATNVGGAGEQIINGKTGLLTPRRDNHALAAAIIELAHDHEARARFGEAARERITTHFSMDAMAEGYSRLCLSPRQSPLRERLFVVAEV